MKKPKSQTEWQERNRKKTALYAAKYRQGKTKIEILLDEETTLAINTLKHSEQSYAAWVRQLIRERLAAN